jgi:hypothetical protein
MSGGKVSQPIKIVSGFVDAGFGSTEFEAGVEAVFKK